MGHAQNVIDTLKHSLGERFDLLDNTERLILAIALTENTVSHTRLKEICEEHHHDLSQKLARLVKDGLLNSNGYGQGMVYHLANESLITPDDVFGTKIEQTSEPQTKTSEPLLKTSEPKEVRSGGLHIEGFNFPIYDSLGQMDSQLREHLEEIVSPLWIKKQYPKEKFKEIVKVICQDKYLTLGVLVKLLNRNEDYLRKNTLNPMVENQELFRAFPHTPNDPRQAYTSSVDRVLQ